MEPRFFRSPAAMRRWLASHHDDARELSVGFFKAGSGKRGITYPEALDEALCFGWIDGVRRSLDAERWAVRFTPRKPGSSWSAVNTRHAERLLAEGKMAPAGKRAFEERDPARTKAYSFERARARLRAAEARQFRANPAAWTAFQRRPPSYQRAALWWVVSAKRPATRARRLATLVACCARGQPVPPLRPRRGQPATSRGAARSPR